MQELLVIFIIALLVVGPKKLPEVARVIGKILGELKRALTEFRFEIDQKMSGQTRVEKAREEAIQAAREMEIKEKEKDPQSAEAAELNDLSGLAGLGVENAGSKVQSEIPEGPGAKKKGYLK